ncbi:MAG: hypothetical protein P1U63_10065 [Coxiellaceae bacterium]|nr:hypothetical protein [Coxiellaceae bacterium]
MNKQQYDEDWNNLHQFNHARRINWIEQLQAFYTAEIQRENELIMARQAHDDHKYQWRHHADVLQPTQAPEKQSSNNELTATTISFEPIQINAPDNALDRGLNNAAHALVMHAKQKLGNSLTLAPIVQAIRQACQKNVFLRNFANLLPQQVLQPTAHFAMPPATLDPEAPEEFTNHMQAIREAAPQHLRQPQPAEVMQRPEHRHDIIHQASREAVAIQTFNIIIQQLRRIRHAERRRQLICDSCRVLDRQGLDVFANTLFRERGLEQQLHTALHGMYSQQLNFSFNPRPQPMLQVTPMPYSPVGFGTLFHMAKRRQADPLNAPQQQSLWRQLMTPFRRQLNR